MGREAQEAFDELRRRVRRYRLDQALALLSRISADGDHPDASSSLPEWFRAGWGEWLDQAQIAYIAKALICGSNDHRGQDLTLEEYQRLASLYDTAMFLGRPSGAAESEQDRFFQERAGQTIFKRMYPRGLRIVRALVLYTELARRDDLRKPFDIPAAFHRLTGFEVEEFMRLGQALFVLAWHESGSWDEGRLVRLLRAMLPVISEARISAFLNHYSIDYTDFRNTCDENQDSDLYSYNPLEHTPVVRTQRSGYVIPVPSLIEDRFSLGIYDDLQKAYGHDFTAAFGHVFEAYVGWLLQSVYPLSQISGERHYGRSRQFLSTDWVIREGDLAVLIECKVTRLSAASRHTRDESAMRRDLGRGIAGALIQLDRVMRDMIFGTPGLEQFRGIRQFVPVVLVNDPYYAANSLESRRVVNDELRAAGVVPYFHQVISVEDLEISLPLLRQKGFAATLQQKMTGTGRVRASEIFPRRPDGTSKGDFLGDFEIGPPYEWSLPQYLDWAFNSDRTAPNAMLTRYKAWVESFRSVN